MKPINNRGQLGLDVAKTFLLTLFGAVIVGFIIIVVAGTLIGNNNIVPDDYSRVAINSTLTNSSTSVVTLFSNATTWMVMIGVAVLILIIAVVIFAVNRFGSNR